MQQIADYGHDTSENILWHPQESALYWLDIPAGQLFRGHFPNLKKEDEQLERFASRCILQMDEPIGGFVFAQTQADCKARFLLFASEGRIYQWEYDHGSENQAKPQLFAQVDPLLVPSRFNDVFALPAGQESRYILCGTMPSEGNADSRLLLFDAAERRAAVVQENLKLANGMGLSPQGEYLYFADTRDFAIYRFAVQDLAQGQMDWKSRHKLVDFHGRPGRPDGLCVDAEGNLWVAETGASLISCFHPEGRELGCLELETPKITSCCFGGSMKHILFVSTQGGHGGPTGGEKAGGIFALNSWSATDDQCPGYQALRPVVGKYFRGQEEALVSP